MALSLFRSVGRFLQANDTKPCISPKKPDLGTFDRAVLWTVRRLGILPVTVLPTGSKTEEAPASPSAPDKSGCSGSEGGGSPLTSRYQGGALAGAGFVEVVSILGQSGSHSGSMHRIPQPAAAFAGNPVGALSAGRTVASAGSSGSLIAPQRGAEVLPSDSPAPVIPAIAHPIQQGIAPQSIAGQGQWAASPSGFQPAVAAPLSEGVALDPRLQLQMQAMMPHFTQMMAQMLASSAPSFPMGAAGPQPQLQPALFAPQQGLQGVYQTVGETPQQGQVAGRGDLPPRGSPDVQQRSPDRP